MTIYKKCNYCKQNKDIKLFVKDKSSKDGFTIECKECKRKRNYQRRKKNKENFKDHIVYDITDSIYNRIKYCATERKIKFNITKAYLLEKVYNQDFRCKLSDKVLCFPKSHGSGVKRYTNASLDRIDSSKGYVVDNVQWVDKDVNMAKQRLSQKKFIEMCKMISENHK